MSSYVRRLPVYLLLDCSGSMDDENGEIMNSIKNGITKLLEELKKKSSNVGNSASFGYYV